MTLSVCLTNFRCFSRVGPIRLAPITILVGENSAGKTSFLAALRSMFTGFSSFNSNTFNREPFFLGSFEQIAHYRGGKAGRAKSFSFEISSEDTSRGTRLPSPNKSFVKHVVTFKKGANQPEIVEYGITLNSGTAIFKFFGEKVNITINTKNNFVYEVPERVIYPSSLMRQQIGYASFILQDMLRSSGILDKSKTPESDSSTPHGDLEHHLRDFVSELTRVVPSLSREVFASAPVRTQPRRVYTPSEISFNSAGEQVPLEMANEKSVRPDKWRFTKDELVSFGKRSGLFDDIDVKRFGSTDSDPFQIQVKNKGPLTNIADVGYGVSQSLPLLYPLFSNSKANMYLLQQPEVHLHPRAQAEFGSLLCEKSAANKDHYYVVETHSDFIVDRVRIGIKSGAIAPEAVTLLFFERDGLDVSINQFQFDKNGDFIGNTARYREFFLAEQFRLLGL